MELGLARLLIGYSDVNLCTQKTEYILLSYFA